MRWGPVYRAGLVILIVPGRSGETGRRTRLKISRRLPGVWVRFPPPAPFDSRATRLRRVARSLMADPSGHDPPSARRTLAHGRPLWSRTARGASHGRPRGPRGHHPPWARRTLAHGRPIWSRPAVGASHARSWQAMRRLTRGTR